LAVGACPEDIIIKLFFSLAFFIYSSDWLEVAS
jgi:hypothetical protein